MAGGGSTSAVLQIGLLGDFRLVYGQTPVTSVDSPRLQAFLAYLILHRDVPQSRHHLAFHLWPDSTETQAHTNLRHVLYNLRRALPAADDYLLANTRTVQWRRDAPCTLDVADFETALVAGGRGHLEHAVELYRGDLLPDCYDDWIAPERARLHNAQVAALRRLIALAEDSRDYHAAIVYARRLLDHDPDSEASYRYLMRLQALNGDRAAALHTYHTCVTVLRRELGVPPDAATIALHQHLLDADGAGIAPEAPPAAVVFPLIGRRAEWAQLQAAWRRACAGRPHMVLIAGEAGVGKTRLVEELSAWASRQGILTASAHGYAVAQALPHAPVAAWLRARPLPALAPVWLTELARVLPELLDKHPGLPHPEPLHQAWQRSRLFEALARGILHSQRPQLLVLEDLQWCDRETLTWLHFLLRFDVRAPLLVTGTLGTGEGDGTGLSVLLAALRHDELLTEFDLGPLEAQETADLAGHVLGRPLEPALIDPLFQGSEGNPLFVVEMMLAELMRGQAGNREHSALEHARARLAAPLPLPRRVQQVLERRLAQLSPEGRELAGLAATVGRQFDLDLLRAAAGLDDEVLVRSLEELWQRRIIREQGAGCYDFSHDKIRETAYAGLSAARRQLLHRRVAQVLAVRHAVDVGAVNGRTVGHDGQ